MTRSVEEVSRTQDGVWLFRGWWKVPYESPEVNAAESSAAPCVAWYNRLRLSGYAGSRAERLRGRDVNPDPMKLFHRQSATGGNQGARG